MDWIFCLIWPRCSIEQNEKTKIPVKLGTLPCLVTVPSKLKKVAKYSVFLQFLSLISAEFRLHVITQGEFLFRRPGEKRRWPFSPAYSPMRYRAGRSYTGLWDLSSFRSSYFACPKLPRHFGFTKNDASGANPHKHPFLTALRHNCCVGDNIFTFTSVWCAQPFLL